VLNSSLFLRKKFTLAMFGIDDPAVLWTHRYRPDSAGRRLKMLLGQRRNVRGARDEILRMRDSQSRRLRGAASPGDHARQCLERQGRDPYQPGPTAQVMTGKAP
jgi:hypothetical protein